MRFSLRMVFMVVSLGSDCVAQCMARDSGFAIRDFKISRISYPGTRIPSPVASFHLFDISRFLTVVQRCFGRAVEPEDSEISFAGHRGLPFAFLIRLRTQLVAGHRERGNCRIARASC